MGSRPSFPSPAIWARGAESEGVRIAVRRAPASLPIRDFSPSHLPSAHGGEGKDGAGGA